METSQWKAALEESILSQDRLPGAQAMHHIVLRATEENISLLRLRMRLRRATGKSAAEKHYPLIMEDLDELLKGVGDWTTITADIHNRAATARGFDHIGLTPAAISRTPTRAQLPTRVQLLHQGFLSLVTQLGGDCLGILGESQATLQG